MKKLSYNRSLLILYVILFSTTSLFAEEVTKRISKSFNLKSDTRIEVNNKYGNVIINKWDKNILDLKVEILVEGKTDSKTQKMLDAIEIEISDRISTGSLSIETRIEGNNWNSSYSINYEINMPGSNPLKLSNSFGNVYLGSYEGSLEVDVRFGQFQAEDLEKANIHIEFSNAMCEIEGLKSGTLDLRYSKMTIDDLGSVSIESQFSDLEIENAGKIELQGKYGKLKIGTIKSLSGEIQFAGLDITNLQESMTLETRHGNGINIENVSDKFKNIEIGSEFSSINLAIESATKSKLQFDLEFGNLKASGAGINFTKVIKEMNSSEYEGYLGNKDATSTIRVNAKHGNIRFEAK